MPQAIINSFITEPVFPGPTPDFRVDASQIGGLADGDPVATWSDVSGNSRDFTQATAGNRPVYKTGGVGGRPYVDFTTDDSLGASNLPTPTSSLTMFMVINNSSSVTQFAFYWGTSSDGFGIGLISPTRAIQLRSGGGTNNSTNGVYTVSIGEVWTVRRNSVGPLSEFWKNGASQVLTDTTGAMGALSAAGVIGAFNPASPSVFWSGDIYEVIGYASILTDPQRSAIESYLMTKYGL